MVTSSSEPSSASICGRRAALTLGQHVRGGGAGKGDVDQVEVQLLGDQMGVVARRPARPERRARRSRAGYRDRPPSNCRAPRTARS